MYHTWVVGSAAGRGHRSGAVAVSIQVRQELALHENSGGLRKRWRVHVLSFLGPCGPQSYSPPGRPLGDL